MLAPVARHLARPTEATMPSPANPITAKLGLLTRVAEQRSAGEARGVRVPEGYYQVTTAEAALDLIAAGASHVRIIPSTREARDPGWQAGTAPPPPAFLPPPGVTTAQARVLAFLRSYHAEHGYMPTLREIGTALGIRSVNGVSEHLRAMQRRGLLTITPNAARAIRLNEVSE
jgi:hypothetical protein